MLVVMVLEAKGNHIQYFVCFTRQEKQSVGEIELSESGGKEREEEGQQETDSQERPHSRDETEKPVATVPEEIRLGALMNSLCPRCAPVQY